MEFSLQQIFSKENSKSCASGRSQVNPDGSPEIPCIKSGQTGRICVARPNQTLAAWKKKC